MKIINLNQALLTSILLFSSFQAFGIEQKRSVEWNFTSFRYLNNHKENYGQRFYFAPQFTTTINENQIIKNQIKAESDTISSDLATKTVLTKKDQFVTSLGENYYRIQNDSQVIQIGYQDVVWGETFGFNYADLINPKNFKITDPYSIDQTRQSIPMLQWKYFGENYSLQFITTFAHSFNKNLPLELFTTNVFTQTQFNIEKDNKVNWFDEFETGFKLSSSFYETDLSIFFLNYVDRDPYYELISATATTLNLKEDHTRLNAAGINLAKNLMDFIIRADLVYKDKKSINYIQNLNLKNYTTIELNSTSSIDTPTFNNFNFSFIYANSKISDFQSNSFRKGKEESIIFKLSKTLFENHKIDSSLLFDIQNKGQALFMAYLLPVGNNHEFKFSSEFFKGPDQSKFNLMKANNKISINLNSIFEL